MRQTPGGGHGSPQKLYSRESSVASSRLKVVRDLTQGRSRRMHPKITSMLIQQRQSLRVVENDLDVTPRPFNHGIFTNIGEGEMTAFETMGIAQMSSSQQLSVIGSSYAAFRISSSSLSRSSSFIAGIHSAEELPIESFLATQAEEEVLTDEEDQAPSEFYFDPEDETFAKAPQTVTITLTETDTIFLYEHPQLIAELQSPEGVAIKEENERYEYITIGAGALRKLVDSDTQTIEPLSKTRGTYFPRKVRRNRGTSVNNWVIYDTYTRPELLVRVNDGLLVERRKESIARMKEAQEQYNKFPRAEACLRERDPQEQLARIFQKNSFKNAVRVIERIIASNLCIVPQKRFKGIIKQDPCSLDLRFTYTLDLLWKHTSSLVQNMPVVSLRWSPSNVDLLAVAYGAEEFAEKTTGVLLVWCMKNPSEPDRKYFFPSSISDIDWSKQRPNLIAVGFYDGSVRIVDISSEIVNITRCSYRQHTPTAGPHWHVQWWPGDEQFQYQEQLYTCNQNGSVYHYRGGEDFLATEIMKLKKIEGKISGIEKVDYCLPQDVPIRINPGALVLCGYPDSNFYFVASDEGCVHRCSTNYLHHHIDSFLAHDGPIYSIEFSTFSPKLFLTCGADWCTRIWVDGLSVPLVTLSTSMACVRCATWSPTHSTIIATIVNNEICVWDIKRKIYRPVSVTQVSEEVNLTKISFTANGNQLVVADNEGQVYLYNLEGMPFPPYNQERVLLESIEKALITKQDLLYKIKKLGPPFGS